MTENQPPPANPPEEPAATVPSDSMTEPTEMASATSPNHSRRNLWLAGGAGAVVAGVALGGVAVGATMIDRHDERSASDERTPPSRSSPLGQDGDQAPGDEMPGGPMAGGPLGSIGRDGALHGEVVFEDASGDYVTMSTQQGQVTALSASSISLDSSDGFSATYAIDDQTRAVSPDADPITDGLAGIKVGDTVNVIALATDGAGTAQLVLEGNIGPGFIPGFGPNGPEAA